MRFKIFTKKLISIVLMAVMLLTFVCVDVPNVYAAEVGDTGTVNALGSVLNVRSKPGTEYKITYQLAQGKRVTVLEETRAADGSKWYQIQFSVSGSMKTGYVHSNYVIMDAKEAYEYDAAFERALDEEGFPEDYKGYLRQLHADHPSWVFVAANTGLEWESVVQKESVLGRSLVASTEPAAWKSHEKGAYNSSTGRYTSYDSGNWNSASRGIIQYYLDPRNFLNELGIFQFLDHSYDSSSQTLSGLKQVVNGTFLDKKFPEDTSKTYSDVIMAAAKKSGVSPYVLASMILIEQGNEGNGGCITGKNAYYPGYYNYYSIGAYRTSTMSAVTRGLWYAYSGTTYMRPWNTRYKAIVGGAEFYGKNYVQKNMNTFYFKKWNVMNGLSNVGKGEYMGNIVAAEAEASVMRRGYTTVLDEELTFYIPVYKNMPKTLCQIPKTIEEGRVGVLAPEGSSGIDTSKDEAEIKFDDELDANAADEPTEEEKLAEYERIKAGVEATKIVSLKAEALTTKKVRLSWLKSNSGFKVDYYQVWRSTKKTSGFVKVFTTENKTYTNNSGLSPGTLYWYKVRGVREVYGNKVYTPFTKISVTTKSKSN